MPCFYTNVTVDGQVFKFQHEGDPCNGGSRAEPAPQGALNKESVARALVAEELHNQFTIPYEMLKKLADDAVKSVNRIGAISDSVAEQGGNQ